ncbi:MAG: serpin family protein [Synergistaceae bacterium]|jgi:serpin B|nr:serpin family protein [Synergistaceae bacterium]
MRFSGAPKTAVLYFVCILIISTVIVTRGVLRDDGVSGAPIVRPEEPAPPHREEEGDALPEVSSDDMASARIAAASINAFAFDLYKELAGGTSSNILFSPYNLASGFAALREDSGEYAEGEIKSVFHYREATPEGISVLAEMFSRTPESFSVFRTEHALMPGVSADISEEWASRARGSFDAEVRKLDYRNGSGASGDINRRAESGAWEGINSLNGDIGPGSGTLSASAVYFRAEWEYEFPPEHTETGPFYTAEGTSMDSPLMRRAGSVDYCETDMFQAVRIPGRKGVYSLIAMLPANKDDLGAQLLSHELFDQVMESFEKTDALLVIPRFRAEIQYELSDHLRGIGLKNTFAVKSDSSGIAEGLPGLGKAVHKTVVEVNEKNASSRPESAVIAGAPQEPGPEWKIFRADHPFLYFIVDGRTNAILAMGRFSWPQ